IGEYRSQCFHEVGSPTDHKRAAVHHKIQSWFDLVAEIASHVLLQLIGGRLSGRSRHRCLQALPEDRRLTSLVPEMSPRMCAGMGPAAGTICPYFSRSLMRT